MDSGKDDLRVKTFKSRAINMLTYSGHYRVVLRGIEVFIFLTGHGKVSSSLAK